MFSDVLQLAGGKNPWSHVAVLDALIRQNGGGQTAAQVGGAQPLLVLRRDGLAALPELPALL